MYTDRFVQRFESKFVKSDGCWIWTASTAGKRYGQIKLQQQRKQEYAHRISYQLYRGEIPEGKYVCHTCDNTICVNPDHLFLGTCKDNLQDMAKKGRSLYGERNSRAKLTEMDVMEIKILLSSGVIQKRIAAAYGISQIEVSRIKNGTRWKHIS